MANQRICGRDAATGGNPLGSRSSSRAGAIDWCSIGGSFQGRNHVSGERRAVPCRREAVLVEPDSARQRSHALLLSGQPAERAFIRATLAHCWPVLAARNCVEVATRGAAPLAAASAARIGTHRKGWNCKSARFVSTPSKMVARVPQVEVWDVN
jgi:hypothetical protein